jgi:hypothetical protein
MNECTREESHRIDNNFGFRYDSIIIGKGLLLLSIGIVKWLIGVINKLFILLSLLPPITIPT